MTEEKRVKPDTTLTEIKNPKKDYRLNCPPHCDIQITEGKSCRVPKFLMTTLKTEGVITTLKGD